MEFSGSQGLPNFSCRPWPGPAFARARCPPTYLEAALSQLPGRRSESQRLAPSRRAPGLPTRVPSTRPGPRPPGPRPLPSRGRAPPGAPRASPGRPPAARKPPPRLWLRWCWSFSCRAELPLQLRPREASEAAQGCKFTPTNVTRLLRKAARTSRNITGLAVPIL